MLIDLTLCSVQWVQPIRDESFFFLYGKRAWVDGGWWGGGSGEGEGERGRVQVYRTSLLINRSYTSYDSCQKSFWEHCQKTKLFTFSRIFIKKHSPLNPCVKCLQISPQRKGMIDESCRPPCHIFVSNPPPPAPPVGSRAWKSHTFLTSLLLFLLPMHQSPNL